MSLLNFRSAFGGYTEIKIVAAGIIEIQPFLLYTIESAEAFSSFLLFFRLEIVKN